MVNIAKRSELQECFFTPIEVNYGFCFQRLNLIQKIFSASICQAEKLLLHEIKIPGVVKGFKSLLIVTQTDVLDEMLNWNCSVTFVDLKFADTANGLFILAFLVNAKSRKWLACVSFDGACGV